MINKEVLENIYNDLLELSSKDLQISYWLVGEQGKISGYTELMCRLFDDDDFDLFVEKDVVDLKVSNEFVQELRLLRDQLNSYSEETKTREEIINDPEWQKIVRQARNVISLWNNEISIGRG